MQVSKVFIVHKHKSICNINDMFSCHFLGLVELVDFEHPTCKGKSIISYWSFCPCRANQLAHHTQGDALG